MHTFFHGWRRKVGVATLVMACVVMGAWIRSTIITDIVNFGGEYPQYRLNSYAGVFEIFVCRPAGDVPRVPRLWKTRVTTEDYDPIGQGGILWRWDWGGFHFGAAGPTPGFAPEEAQFYAIPYWSITCPLTLLSAYLILWKRRKRV